MVRDTLLVTRVRDSQEPRSVRRVRHTSLQASLAGSLAFASRQPLVSAAEQTRLAAASAGCDRIGSDGIECDAGLTSHSLSCPAGGRGGERPKLKVSTAKRVPASWRWERQES
jgi:hypothetical protein